MVSNSFDRYSQFRKDGEIELVPFGEIPVKDSDFYEVYKKNGQRLDQISYKYYGSPDYAWLIMQANPQYGSIEFRIPDSVTLRIPYPLASSLQAYQESINEHKKLYSE